MPHGVAIEVVGLFGRISFGFSDDGGHARGGDPLLGAQVFFSWIGFVTGNPSSSMILNAFVVGHGPGLSW